MASELEGQILLIQESVFFPTLSCRTGKMSLKTLQLALSLENVVDTQPTSSQHFISQL